MAVVQSLMLEYLLVEMSGVEALKMVEHFTQELWKGGTQLSGEKAEVMDDLAEMRAAMSQRPAAPQPDGPVA
jgi:hypothetical protein